MTIWNISPTEKFDRVYKRFEKKHVEELIAVMENLNRYIKVLQSIDNPLQINAGFIHPETQGIIAIDQKKAKKKLRETRLYVYPYDEIKTLFLLTIGDKNSQQRDIKLCVDLVNAIKKG